MKRKPFVVGIAAVALVLGLAAWQFARPSAAEGARLERYLPADTIGFVQANNLRAQALNVIESEAWRAFTKENQSASSLFMIGANHMGVLDASYAVALVGMSGEGGKPHPEFVLVAEFTDGSARRTFENRVLRLAQQSGEKSTTRTEEKYGDRTINILSKDGKQGFAYAQAGNLLFVSNTTGAVKKVLDVRGGKVPSLDSNQTFKQTLARAAYTEGMFGYLDGAALTRLIDNAPVEEHKGAAAFRQFFHGAGADSVQTVAFTSSFADGRVTERFVVATQPGGTGILSTIAKNPPTSQSLLALVPENALQAFDASIASAPQAFDEMEALLNQINTEKGRKTLGDVLGEVSSKTGIDLRNDILGALGSEVCIAQLQAGEDRMGVVILNLKDEQRFAQALEKLAEHKKRALAAREYKGVTIRQLSGEEGRGLHYAFIGGNFVASGDGAAIERVVDTAQGGGGISASAGYRSASAQLSGNPQFVYYNSNADYLNRLGKTLTRGESEFKSSGQAANLRPSFAFGVARADGFYVESHSPLGTFPRLLTMVSSRLTQEKNNDGQKKGASE
ncbi:MAG TPA: DUF3352 domain-containing protein [Pyrinomonadaceae bacterium]|nr:DUF3352 domain-containing protein [Pyrinomonadaceae bacterium]